MDKAKQDKPKRRSMNAARLKVMNTLVEKIERVNLARKLFERDDKKWTKQ